MQRNPRMIFVGNLPSEADYKVIESAFIPFGDIRSINIVTDPITQEKRGFAFVEYDEESDAEHAIFNMHNSELGNKIIRVEAARPIRDKELLNKPIWADEDYFQKYGASNE